MTLATAGRKASGVDLSVQLGWKKNIMAHDVGTVVLRHLASTQDNLRVCRSVSKECRALVDAQVHTLKANLSSLCTSGHLPLKFPRLQRLAFDRVSSDSSASSLLSQLAQEQPHLLGKLQSLDLSNCQGVEADALAQLLKACTRLSCLTMPPLAGSVTSARRDFMEVLSTHASQLTHLLGAGDYICPASIQLLPQLPNLQHLDISPGKFNIVLTPPMLQPIGQLTKLQHLQLGNHLACYDTCALAASLPALKSLVFSYVDDYAVEPHDLAPLTYSRSLQELQLCSVICSDDLLAVVARTPVTSLTLHAGRFAASPKGAAGLQQQLAHLQVRVTDRDLGAFAAALPVLKGLRSLAVGIHRAAEDCTALMQAIFGLSQLHFLTLESHYSGLKEAELLNLPLLPQLQRLSLLNHFSDATLCSLLRCTPQLTHLKLTSCGSVGDVGLGCIVSHCKRLKEVHLELMRGASVAGVAALAAGPCVRRVVVEGCRNVLAEECREVQRLLSKLELEVVKLR